MNDIFGGSARHTAALFAVFLIALLMGLLSAASPSSAANGINRDSGISNPDNPFANAISGVQYWQPPLTAGGVGSWVTAGSTIYVLVGTKLTLQALPSPAQALFPAGEPVWGGAPGSGGTGNTLSLSFAGPGSYTITVGIGTQTQQIGVIAFDFSLSFAPAVDFPGRSYTDFGVGEVVNVQANLVPSDLNLTAAEVGGLALIAPAELSAIDNRDGTASFTIPEADADAAYSISFALSGGPSALASEGTSVTGRVPTGIVQVELDNKLIHYHDSWSVGFACDVFVVPANVSFIGLKIQEQQCKSTATGNLSPTYAGILHDQGSADLLDTVVPNVGTRKANFDIPYCGTWFSESQSIYATGGAGTFDWNIPVNWIKSASHPLTTVDHNGTCSTGGDGTLSKARASDCDKWGDQDENTDLHSK